MSIMQRLTLIGLYNYEQQYDRDLFSNLVLPDGFDKPTFINSLLLEHGEKCVLYTEPDFFISAIGIWSAKYSLELSRIYEALTAEYNPIYNYDRYEESSDSHGKKYTSETSAGGKLTSQTNAGGKLTSETNAGTSSTSLTNAGHKAKDTPKYDDDVTNDYDVVTSQDIDGTTEHQVSADNSSSYQPESKDFSNVGRSTVANDGTIKRHIEGTTQDLTESSNSQTSDRTDNNSKTTDQTTNNSKTVDQTTNNSKTIDSEAINDSHNAHLYGNIGVTTSAAMVSEVVAQRFKMSLYGTACKMFANDLLLGIY